MTDWHDILHENEVEHAEILRTEECSDCGTLLCDHIDSLGRWTECVEH